MQDTRSCVNETLSCYDLKWIEIPVLLYVYFVCTYIMCMIQSSCLCEFEHILFQVHKVTQLSTVNQFENEIN